MQQLILQPTSAQPVPLGWYKVESSDTKDAEVKVQVKMDIPDSMKKFGSEQQCCGTSYASVTLLS